jgi:hypothetical protein
MTDQNKDDDRQKNSAAGASIALGSGIGVALGAGVGAAMGNVALGAGRWALG